MGGRKDSMLKVENACVTGFEAAVHGMRNPLNSWAKSDSENVDGYVTIGPNDYKLMMNLCKGGPEESKWRRMVHVSCDVTAPLYWWKEYDTYKVGTVANSCSTMHKIAEKEFTLDDFSHEQLIITSPYEYTNAKTHLTDIDGCDTGILISPCALLVVTIGCLNNYRKQYLETKDKKWWWQMIQLLPSSYNQRRTIDLNYEVLAAQYRQRKAHKLDEWHTYCDWIKSLPYAEFITE